MSVLHLYQRPYSKLAKRTTDIVGAVLLLLLAAPLFPLAGARGARVGPGHPPDASAGSASTARSSRCTSSARCGGDAERPGEAVWARQGRSADHRRRQGHAPPPPRRATADLEHLPRRHVARRTAARAARVHRRAARGGSVLDRRHLVKPGITGWAQVNRGYTADSEGSLDKLSYDLWYIRHRSLTVDLVICARTLSAVLRGEWRRTAPADLTMSDLDPVSDLLRFTGPPRPLESET